MWIQKKYKEWCDLAKSKSRIRNVGGKRALFISELAKLWDIGANDAVATINENRLLTVSDKEKDIGFYADQQSMREAVMSGKDKIFLQSSCFCCRSYLSSCHRTASDANLSDDPHTFHYQDYFVIAEISNCLGAFDDPMFLWISLNSCPLNLLLVRSHQAEIIIVKRLIQGRNNVTRVRLEPR